MERIEHKTEQKYLDLAEKLDELQRVKNSGRGVSTVRGIISSLRRGDIAGARAEAMNDGDKIISYTDIEDIISIELFDGERYPYSKYYKSRLEETI